MSTVEDFFAQHDDWPWNPPRPVRATFHYLIAITEGELRHDVETTSRGPSPPDSGCGCVPDTRSAGIRPARPAARSSCSNRTCCGPTWPVFWPRSPRTTLPPCSARTPTTPPGSSRQHPS
ncbi:hypothetical protein [Streptomyces sp. NBC_00989]|uniref:hypothetical protein n=1 Tax=Streptomyces sp. NBC_00989 TaxID=2903705 RepID=UPI003866BEEC|nr:hypothetical protein OG714_51530 [Streptomyces sp. NBC_00989]